MLSLAQTQKKFLIKFLCVFAFLYGGTYGFIALASPSGKLSWPIFQALDYVAAYRKLLLHGAGQCLEWLGYTAAYPDAYRLQINDANRVQLVYDCLGIGIISFWIAWCIAATHAWKFRLVWIFGGSVLITLLNMQRIALLLIAHYEHWNIFAGIDHHDMYNIVIYTVLLLLLLLHYRLVKE
jgi:exosortase/archaeosortase family protein